MSDPRQGDGTHIVPGSVQGELLRLRRQIQENGRRIRELEGALRDAVNAAAISARVLEMSSCLTDDRLSGSFGLGAK